MFDKGIFNEVDEMSSDNLVRGTMFDLFSSAIFLGVAITYSISFILSIVNLIINLEITNLLNLIIPILILISIWGTYNMAINGLKINTKGLKIIRGIFTLLLILFGILIFLFLLLSFIGGVIFILIAFLFGIPAIAYFAFRKTITNFITALEDGVPNTDWFTASMVFLSLSAVLIFIGTIFLYYINSSSIIQQFPQYEEILSTLSFSQSQKVLAIINQSIALIYMLLLVIFLYKSKDTLERIKVDYHHEFLDYKISQDVIESDKEIKDQDKYN